MSSLRDHIFQQYAANGLNRLSVEYRKRYLPKKGDRFNWEGITYEIGSPKVCAGIIEFEISSKIPQADLLPDASLNAYFDAVKGQVLATGDVPVSVDMSSILREKGSQKDEERGYVRLQFRYAEKDLFSDQEVAEEVKKIQENRGHITLPPIPEVNTLAAKLVLLWIQERTYERAKNGMEGLIKANELVRKELCRT